MKSSLVERCSNSLKVLYCIAHMELMLHFVLIKAMVALFYNLFDTFIFVAFHILCQNMPWYILVLPSPTHSQPIENTSQTMTPMTHFTSGKKRERTAHMSYVILVNCSHQRYVQEEYLKYINNSVSRLLCRPLYKRRGDLGLVIYSGQSLTLIHIHSSSVPYVCPALKKTNTGYPSLSSKSPLSPHYPPFIGPYSLSFFMYFIHIFYCISSRPFSKRYIFHKNSHMKRFHAK